MVVLDGKKTAQDLKEEINTLKNENIKLKNSIR